MFKITCTHIKFSMTIYTDYRGYLAPAMRCHLTEKTDVFAFGVVALEIVTGRSNSDPRLEPDQIYSLNE